MAAALVRGAPVAGAGAGPAARDVAPAAREEGGWAFSCPWQPQLAASVSGALPRAGRVAVPREGLNTLAQYDEQAPPAIDDYATKEDYAYLLAKLNALTTSPATAGTTLSQMTTLPSRPSNQPLIVGGHQPTGYIYVGTHHHGGPIWGSVDTVSLSMMDSPADAAATRRAESQ